MRPGTITASNLHHPFTAKAIWEWLQKNGVRHYVPEDARIIITGTHIITPTFDIGRAYNPGYARGYKQGKEMPIKIRTYRIRHELTIPRGGKP